MSSIVSVFGRVTRVGAAEPPRFAVESEAGQFEIRGVACLSVVARHLGQRVHVAGALYVKNGPGREEISYIDPFYVGFDEAPETLNTTTHFELLCAIALADNKCAFCPWAGTECVKNSGVRG